MAIRNTGPDWGNQPQYGDQQIGPGNWIPFQGGQNRGSGSMFVPDDANRAQNPDAWWNNPNSGMHGNVIYEGPDGQRYNTTPAGIHQLQQFGFPEWDAGRLDAQQAAQRADNHARQNAAVQSRNMRLQRGAALGYPSAGPAGAPPPFAGPAAAGPSGAAGPGVTTPLQNQSVNMQGGAPGGPGGMGPLAAMKRAFDAQSMTGAGGGPWGGGGGGGPTPFSAQDTQDQGMPSGPGFRGPGDGGYQQPQGGFRNAFQAFRDRLDPAGAGAVAGNPMDPRRQNAFNFAGGLEQNYSDPMGRNGSVGFGAGQQQQLQQMIQNGQMSPEDAQMIQQFVSQHGGAPQGGPAGPRMSFPPQAQAGPSPFGPPPGSRTAFPAPMQRQGPAPGGNPMAAAAWNQQGGFAPGQMPNFNRSGGEQFIRQMTPQPMQAFQQGGMQGGMQALSGIGQQQQGPSGGMGDPARGALLAQRARQAAGRGNYQKAGRVLDRAGQVASRMDQGGGASEVGYRQMAPQMMQAFQQGGMQGGGYGSPFGGAMPNIGGAGSFRGYGGGMDPRQAIMRAMMGGGGMY